MFKLMRTSLSIAALAIGLQAPLWAQPVNDDAPVRRSGVDSTLLRMVPAEGVEGEATQQYNQLKQQAAQKKALAPDDYPDLVRLRAIARRMLPHTTRWNERASKWTWEINVIGSDQINAFCMPGGKIAVYSGLIKALKPSDDELAIVMGHEIAHALLEHSRERMAKGQLTQLGAGVISQLFGFGQIGNTALGLGANLLGLKFSRGDETEADSVGLELAARSGFDPRAGISLWQKMDRAAQGAPPEWFSSHPKNTNRIRELEAQLPRVLPLYQRAGGKAQ